MVRVKSYAKRVYSSGDVDVPLSPVIRGFTPINRRASLPSYSTSVEKVDLRVAQEENSPKVQSKAITSGKKRSASHLPTASVTAKKPRKVSQPSKSKNSAKSSGLSNREISNAFVQSKPACKSSLSIKANSRMSNRDEQEEVTAPVQPANIGARVSTQTMRKLDAFRYQARDQTRHHGGLSPTCQNAVPGQRITVAESTSQLAEAGTIEIYEDITEQDNRAQQVFQQDSGSGQGTHDYPFDSTYSSERSPKMAPHPSSHNFANAKWWSATSSGISPKEIVGEQARSNATASSLTFKQTFPESILEAPPRNSYLPGGLRNTALCETSNCPEGDASLTPRDIFSRANIGTVNH